MDIEFILDSLLFLIFFGGLAVFIERKTTASHREVVDRAEQIMRALSPERIIDDPRILNQPEIPERMFSFMTKQQVHNILTRDPIDDVIVLPRVRKKDARRISWIGNAIFEAILIATFTTMLYTVCRMKPAIIIGVVFFFIYCIASSVWRSCRIVPKEKMERLLRRLTRDEAIETLQLAKIRSAAPGKQTGKASRHLLIW